jgi:hypothetical protein
VPGVRHHCGRSITGTSEPWRRGEQGQGTVEWVGLVAVVALALAALVAAGARLPGADLARAVASRILCAASLADGCGDEPTLIATYGDEVGRLVRRHMPTLLFERGARALPVDFRRCRSTVCGDGTPRGLVHRTDDGMHVTAFAHVIDCRGGNDGAGGLEEWIDGGSATSAGAARGTAIGPPNCSGERAGHLYIQYWIYYADSATLRGVPIAGDLGYHHDDWESVQIRIGRDGRIDERASSHDGYNSTQSVANDPSDAGIAPLKDAAEFVGARPRNGWGSETHILLVSGGSHAGNTNGYLNVDRVTPGRRVHLVPLEPIAAEEGWSYRFAVNPPWRKRVWRDPEAEGTG